MNYKYESIKTSDIARNIVSPTMADKKHLIFGKVFEEVYTEYTWLHDNAFRITKNKFIRKLAAMLKAEGVDDNDLIKKSYRIFSCFLKEGLVGRKPKSMSKDIIIRILETEYTVSIYAQPDLFDGNTYYEFKTGPINEYSRVQSQIFHWVIEEPIILVGIEEDEKGYINAQKEIIDYCDVDIEAEVKKILEGI